MDQEPAPQSFGHDFLIEEYKTLREEILSKVERSIRLQLIGVTAIPLVIGSGQGFELTFAVAVSPIVTTLFILILLYENIGIMRAGKYIRTKIEPALREDGELGWESWLELDRINRKPERVFAWASYIAFCLYYIGGTYMAHEPLQDLFPPPVGDAITAIYSVFFFVILRIVISELPTSTKTPGETRRTERLFRRLRDRIKRLFRGPIDRTGSTPTPQAGG
jgi:hypothetical protein